MRGPVRRPLARRIAIGLHDTAGTEIHHFKTQANAAQGHFRFRKLFIPPPQRLPNDTPVAAIAACRHAFAMKSRRRLAKHELFILTTSANIFDREDDEYFYVTNLDYSSIAKTCPKVTVLSLFYLGLDSDFDKAARMVPQWRRMSDTERTRVLSASIVLNLLSALTASVVEVPTHEIPRGCVVDYCQSTFDVVKPVAAGFPFCETCQGRLRRSHVGRAVLAIARRLTARPFAQRAPRIFISYSRPDRRPAVRLRRDLMNRGYDDVFLDTKTLNPGSRWRADIVQRLRSSDSVLICLSTRSRFDGFFAEEIQKAVQLGREKPKGFVLPVRFDDCARRSPLEGFNFIDLFPHWSSSVDRLSASIARHQARPRAAPPRRP